MTARSASRSLGSSPGQGAGFRQPRFAGRHEEGNRPMYIGVGTIVVIVIIVLVILLLRRSR